MLSLNLSSYITLLGAELTIKVPITLQEFLKLNANS